MKNIELTQRDIVLTAEDQNVNSLVSNIEISMPTASHEDDVRNELADAIGGLGKSIQLLVLLLDQNDIINMLPEVAVPQYSDIMDNISEAALKGMEAVLKSHELDKSFALVVEEECRYLQ